MVLKQGSAMAAFGGSLFLGVFMMFQLLYRRYLKARWFPVGDLDEIHLYPLKSGAPTNVPMAYCHKQGLHPHHYYDREFVVYEEATGLVITSRIDPNLLRIRVKPTRSPSVLLFTSSTGIDPLEIDLSNISGGSRNVAMKFPKTKMEVMRIVDCGDDAASWLFKELCRAGLRLGYCPVNYQRDICKTREKGTYTEVGSFLLLNKASLNDILSRTPRCEHRDEDLRADFVIDSCVPYDENNWKMLKIGDAVFKIVKPCASFRQLEDFSERETGKSNVMCCHMDLEVAGKIRIGDTVYAMYSQPKSNILPIFNLYL